MRHRVGGLDVGDVLSHDDRKAEIEVPVDVAMEEPRSGVVRLEADGDVVTIDGRARAHDVAENRVVVVVGRTPCAADDGEDVLQIETSSDQLRNGLGGDSKDIRRADGMGEESREAMLAWLSRWMSAAEGSRRIQVEGGSVRGARR